MEIEERVENVEGRTGRLEDRTTLLQQAILQMKDLVISHNDRLDDYFAIFRQSREDFEFKLNALIDAQMRNEAGIAEVKGAITEINESIVGLREASKSQLIRIEKLEDE